MNQEAFNGLLGRGSRAIEVRPSGGHDAGVGPERWSCRLNSSADLSVPLTCSTCYAFPDRMGPSLSKLNPDRGADGNHAGVQPWSTVATSQGSKLGVGCSSPNRRYTPAKLWVARTQERLGGPADVPWRCASAGFTPRGRWA